jgi:hypothetical protein
MKPMRVAGTLLPDITMYMTCSARSVPSIAAPIPRMLDDLLVTLGYSSGSSGLC